MEYDISTNGGDRTAAIVGRVTFKEQSDFRELLAVFFAEKSPRYVLDLNQVQHIDSAGLGMLLIARKRAQGHGADVVLRRPPQDVMMTLELTKFDDLFTIET